ncbi:MAG: BON domain-containing protein [Glaciimonas sp.]|nr:BON domain-containing protein [Glaciimonas sp.]
MSHYLGGMVMIEQQKNLQPRWQQRWQLVRRPLAAVVLCTSVLVSLQGCVGMMVGGAVVGTLAATDRRTLGAQTEDKAIVVKGELRIPNLVGDAGHVNVTSFNRRVLLTGEVRDAQMKAAVEREAQEIEGAKAVVNELEIAGLSSFTSRANDTLITGKIKASFVDAKDMYANSVKVVTERGSVYLMGRVTQREGELAGSIASGVAGVQKVVKIFDYISEDELRSLSNEQEPAH